MQSFSARRLLSVYGPWQRLNHQDDNGIMLIGSNTVVGYPLMDVNWMLSGQIVDVSCTLIGCWWYVKSNNGHCIE